MQADKYYENHTGCLKRTVRDSLEERFSVLQNIVSLSP